MKSECKYRRSLATAIPLAFENGRAIQQVLHCCAKTNPMGMCVWDRFGIHPDGVTMCDEVEVEGEIITRIDPLEPLRGADGAILGVDP